MNYRPPSDEELEMMEVRLRAASSVIPRPWKPLRETKDGVGGSSFICGGDPEQDHEIYIELNLVGEVVGSPDPRLDEVIEFLGHSADDLERLIFEVRRLRGNA